jgi:SAM-dependent methyltransferase
MRGWGLPSVRKVFHESGSVASDPGYWEDQWAAVDVPRALRRLRPETSIVLRELMARVPRSGRVLEAGCGSGVILAYLAGQGCDVYGLDFAVLALQALGRQVPSARVVGGDLARLPFPDGSFDCVISLGTLEHFEEGPELALAEHRRILRDGGTLLIFMPRLSLLKRWNDWRALRLGRTDAYLSARRRIVTRVTRPAMSGTQTGSFIQYEFPRRVFLAYLRAADFTPVAAFPTGNDVGIGESRLARRISSGRHPIDDAGGPVVEADLGLDVDGASSSTAFTPTPGPLGRLKAAVIAEQSDGLWAAPVVRFARTLLGHVDFVVATAGAATTDRVSSRSAVEAR